MRTSQIAALSGIVFIVLLIVGLVAALRFAISSVAGDADTGALVMRDLDFDGFSEIAIEGVWRVELIRSDDWSLEIGVSEDSDVDLDVVGNRLILGGDNSSDSDSDGFFASMFGESRQHLALIGLPDLDLIDIDGAASVELRGFDGDRLIISIRGGANIEGHDSRFTDVELNVSGGGNIDLTDVSSVNADVDLSGAGNIGLTMNGGELSGELSGLGVVSYVGTVSREHVEVTGLGGVRRPGQERRRDFRR